MTFASKLYLDISIMTIWLCVDQLGRATLSAIVRIFISYQPELMIL